MQLWDLPISEEESVKFLQKYNILHQYRKCECSKQMKLYFGDDIFWKCNTKSCGKKKRLRVGNWLQNSKIPLCTTVRFIFCWCEELTSIEFCERQLNISKNTAVDWNMYMREICAKTIENESDKKIGGEGKVVKIEQSLFTKRKNNNGRVLPQQWVFGGVCHELNQYFVVKVLDRSSKTVVGIIKEKIQPGSTIISNCWKCYKTSELEKAGFSDLKVDLKINFVDFNMGADDQNVESFWGNLEGRSKKQRGTAHQHLESYLLESLFRQKYKNTDLFDVILNKISQFSPPQF